MMDLSWTAEKYMFSGETFKIKVNINGEDRDCEIHFYTREEVFKNNSIWEIIVGE